MPSKAVNSSNKNLQKDMNHIREDLDSLRGNVMALSQAVQADLKKEASYRVKQVQHVSNKAIDSLEDQVKRKPAQSLGVAFCAGLICSALASRRH